MSVISAFKLPSARFELQRRVAGVLRRSKDIQNDGAPDQRAQNAEHASIRPSKHTPRPLRVLKETVDHGGPLRPFRLLSQDLKNLGRRWISDWLVFNQLIVASAVYVFFTNLLPGITFASDLFVLTGRNWGTIEVVLSTGLSGLIFALCVVSTLACIPASTICRLQWNLASLAAGAGPDPLD